MQRYSCYSYISLFPKWNCIVFLFCLIGNLFRIREAVKLCNTFWAWYNSWWIQTKTNCFGFWKGGERQATNAILTYMKSTSAWRLLTSAVHEIRQHYYALRHSLASELKVFLINSIIICLQTLNPLIHCYPWFLSSFYSIHYKPSRRFNPILGLEI